LCLLQNRNVRDERNAINKKEGKKTEGESQRKRRRKRGGLGDVFLIFTERVFDLI
jgi:hypothetical protein